MEELESAVDAWCKQSYVSNDSTDGIHIAASLGTFQNLMVGLTDRRGYTMHFTLILCSNMHILNSLPLLCSNMHIVMEDGNSTAWPAHAALSLSLLKVQENLSSFLAVIPSTKVENHLVSVMARTFSSYNMHTTMVERNEKDSLSLYVSTEVAYSGHVWRTRCEAKNAVASKLVQSMTQEEDSALAYGEIVVDKNKLTSTSYLAIDSEITVPKHDECYNILNGLPKLWFKVAHIFICLILYLP
jgi:hypothetical protein